MGAAQLAKRQEPCGSCLLPLLQVRFEHLLEWKLPQNLDLAGEVRALLREFLRPLPFVGGQEEAVVRATSLDPTNERLDLVEQFVLVHKSTFSPEGGASNYHRDSYIYLLAY